MARVISTRVLFGLCVMESTGLQVTGVVLATPLYDGMNEFDRDQQGWRACNSCRLVTHGENSWFEGGTGSRWIDEGVLLAVPKRPTRDRPTPSGFQGAKVPAMYVPPRGCGAAQMTGTYRYRHTVHRTWISVGERLLRKLEFQAALRVPRDGSRGAETQEIDPRSFIRKHQKLLRVYLPVGTLRTY
jgi:hypothetical protein